MEAPAHDAPEYAPAVGMPDDDDMARAIAEFSRLYVLDPETPPVLVATMVPLQAWLHPSTREYKGVKFQVTFASPVTSATTADLFIESIVAHPAHAFATAKIVRLLRDYDGEHVLKVLHNFTMGEENLHFQPDILIQPDNPLGGEPIHHPRVIIEVEFDSRTFGAAHARCVGFFKSTATLRASILIQLFPRQVDNTFAAVAVLYHRQRGQPRDSGLVFDAVSFGTAELGQDVVRSLEQSESHRHDFRVRMLAPAPTGAALRDADPWLDVDHLDSITAARVMATHRAAAAIASAASITSSHTAVEHLVDIEAVVGNVDAPPVALVNAANAAAVEAAGFVERVVNQEGRYLHAYQAAGPYLRLDAADVFDGAHLSNGLLYHATEPWFLDLWQILRKVEALR